MRTALVTAMVAVACLSAGADQERVRKRDSAIQLVGDLGTALDRAGSDGMPVVLLFSAAWCPVCRHLEDVTLLEPSLQALGDDVVWVKVDVDRELSLAQSWGVEATPTIFLLDSAGAVRRTVVGGPRAEDLARWIRGMLGPGSGTTTQEDGGGFQRESSPLTVTPQGYRGRSICFSHVGYGPLNMSSQSPFQALRLGIVPRTPSTLTRGEQQLRLRGTWSNTWANDEDRFDPASGELGDFLLDYESLDASLAWAFGISDPLQIEVAYEQQARFGGVLDGLIEGFHELFNLGQSGRDEFPRDRTYVYVDPRNGSPPIVLTGGEANGTFARNLLVTFQHNVTCGSARWPAVSWAVTGRYSLERPEGLDGGNFDVAVSAALSRRFGRFYTYLTLGYAWFDSDAVYSIELRDSQTTLLAAGEWRFRPRMSLLVQYLRSEGAARDLGVFSDASNEVVLGWKWEARRSGVLELGLLENIIDFNNSPDFGVHAAWTQRF